MVNHEENSSPLTKQFDWRKAIEIDPSIADDKRKEIEEKLDNISEDPEGIKLLKNIRKSNRKYHSGNKLKIISDEGIKGSQYINNLGKGSGKNYSGINLNFTQIDNIYIINQYNKKFTFDKFGLEGILYHEIEHAADQTANRLEKEINDIDYEASKIQEKYPEGTLEKDYSQKDQKKIASLRKQMSEKMNKFAPSFDTQHNSDIKNYLNPNLDRCLIDDSAYPYYSSLERYATEKSDDYYIRNLQLSRGVYGNFFDINELKSYDIDVDKIIGKEIDSETALAIYQVLAGAFSDEKNFLKDFRDKTVSPILEKNGLLIPKKSPDQIDVKNSEISGLAWANLSTDVVYRNNLSSGTAVSPTNTDCGNKSPIPRIKDQ